MAFNDQEKQIISYGRANGKSREEIETAIANLRSGVKPIAQPPQEKAGILDRIVSDIPSDIKETVSGIGESISGAQKTAEDVVSRVETGETTPVKGTLQTIGAGLRAGAEAIGKGVLGAGKMLLPEEAEQSVSDIVGTAVGAVAKSKPAQILKTEYEALTPEQQRNVQGGLGVVEGLGTLVGFAPVVSKLRGALSDTAVSALNASDDALRRARASIPEAPKVNLKTGKNILKDVRYRISDIDPQVKTVLERSNFDEVNRYFQQANAHKIDGQKITPMGFVGDTYGVSAFDAIDEARKNAIRGKKAILENAKDQRVTGNTLNDVMSTGIQRMNERFGANIKSDGTITQSKGRTLKLDESDQKLVREYFSRLNSLGVAPTVQQVDDFVDWAQGQLYKQSKTMSKYEVASEPVVRELQGVTGDLNTRLKTSVGGGYGEVNARISDLIELQDGLSRALGADARKGAGLMKTIFSPSGDQTRKLFARIKDETGIDLVKESTLAKFAMESVGDVKQNSLLKQIDIAKDVAEFDLTKPFQALKFLLEKGDLDGQELANEIIRRARTVSEE